LPPPARDGFSRRAFSLIELLTGIGLLAIVMMITAVLFADSIRSWQEGISGVRAERAGRLALGSLMRDLQYAVADTTLTFRVRQDRNLIECYGLESDEICFVSFQSRGGNTNRVAAEVAYWVREMSGADGSNRFELVRGFRPVTKAASTNGCYGNPAWYEEPPAGAGRPASVGVVAENVAAFRLGAADPSGGIVIDYDSEAYGHRLPRYLDICLEVLDPRAARRIARSVAGGEAVTARVDAESGRFTGRVHFHNRNGYVQR
jgi:prepilin-type N-terminal cleavage/methylation domain-containing protein